MTRLADEFFTARLWSLSKPNATYIWRAIKPQAPSIRRIAMPVQATQFHLSTRCGDPRRAVTVITVILTPRDGDDFFGTLIPRPRWRNITRRQYITPFVSGVTSFDQRSYSNITNIVQECGAKWYTRIWTWNGRDYLPHIRFFAHDTPKHHDARENINYGFIIDRLIVGLFLLRSKI